MYSKLTNSQLIDRESNKAAHDDSSLLAYELAERLSKIMELLSIAILQLEHYSSNEIVQGKTTTITELKNQLK